MGCRIFAIVLILLGGCVRYYRVTDPGGGHVYFTQQVEEQSSGAIKFNDMQTNSRVTLQASEVKQIQKADLPAELRPK